jgi:Tfp pilus assembly protein PilE
MKRLIVLNYLLLIIFNTCISSGKIVETKFLSLPWTSFSYLLDKSHSLQEGFCSDTIIKTSFGYRPISVLVEGDIVIDYEGSKKKVIAVSKQYVNRYIKFVVGNTVICTGYDQLYYTFHSDMWLAAHNIVVGDTLLNDINEPCSVLSVELINEDRLLYYLTVQDHIFCITSYNLCVHNAEALIFGVSSTCLGHITMINPVVATIGATVALSAVAYKAYQSYMHYSSNNDEKISLPTDVILAERFYYIQRSTDLETIRQEFIGVKNGLENLKVFCGTSSTNFTHQFLAHTAPLNICHKNQFLQISAVGEMQLSDNQKENLRLLRENELKRLEQEIIAIQVILAFHVNELIEQICIADNEYKNIKKEIESATTLWNDNRNRMTDVIALQSYKADLLEDYLLNNLDRKVDELKIVARYYSSCMNAMSIKKSTNIIDLLEKINPVIIEYEQQIVKEKKLTTQKMFVSEQYFMHRGISVGHIKNETEIYFQKRRNDRNAQIVAETKNRLESIVVSGSPQNNNNNDDDDCEDFWQKLKTCSDKSARSAKFGRLYRDAVTKLWWSKDLAQHGGSFYKVFKETAKGFEWVYDAAKDGSKILNKNKGPIGSFIPYKEVVFRV